MALAIQSEVSSTTTALPFCGFPRVMLYASLDGCLRPCRVCIPLLLSTDYPGPSQPRSVLPASLPSQHGDTSISQLFYIAGYKPMSSLTSLGVPLGARVYRLPAVTLPLLEFSIKFNKCQVGASEDRRATSPELTQRQRPSWGCSKPLHTPGRKVCPGWG